MLFQKRVEAHVDAVGWQVAPDANTCQVLRFRPTADTLVQSQVPAMDGENVKY